MDIKIGMCDREFKDNVTKSDIIVGFFAIIFLIGVIFVFIAILDKEMDNARSRLDTVIDEYTTKAYVVCDVKVKNGRYNYIAVKEDEFASYDEEKKSFMMSLHALSTDDITGITIHTGKERR